MRRQQLWSGGVNSAARLLVRAYGSDLSELQSQLPGSALIVCRTEAEVVASLNRPGVCALIWGLSSKSPWGVRIPATVLEAGRDMLWVMRADLSPGAMREMATFARGDLDWRASLVGFDSLIDDAEDALLGRLTRDCYPALVRAADAAASPDAISLVCPALIAGRRRLTARRFASRLGVSPSTLEWRFRRFCLPTPREVIDESTLLHTLWRLQVLGVTPKEAARLGHFSDSTALGDFLQRRLGVRSRYASHTNSFDRLLDDFSQVLRATRSRHLGDRQVVVQNT